MIVYHLIFVVKYRKPLLVRYGQRMKELLQQMADASDVEVKEMEVDRDHIHLMVLGLPKLSPAQIVRQRVPD